MAHQRLVRNLARALEAAAPADFEVFEGLNIRVGRDRIMIPDIAVLTKHGFDALIDDQELVALVVEVTSPSNAWVDRLVKPDAYAGAGIPSKGFVTSTRAARGRLTLKEPFPVELDLAALATATRYLDSVG